MNVRNRSEAQGSGAASPAKPPGILLTPGTATARRKTVSFGAGVVDNEEKNAIGKSGVPHNCPGRFPSPWTPKVDESLYPTRRTTLTKTLEAARDGNHKKSGSTKNNAPATAKKNMDTETPFDSAAESDTEDVCLDVIQSEVSESNATNSIPVTTTDDFDGDMTIDLNDPHSQSGRYWKSEYERYHEEAKAEMRKLVKYKQLAKSFARKKDSEATDLGEKLREEQQKVANMEAKVSELVAQIADRRLDGLNHDDSDLIKDLARQTALAMEYRDQVDQFEATLQEGGAQPDQQNDRGGQKYTFPRTTRILIETSQELKKAREQLAEMGSFRDEMHSLRRNLPMAEKKVSKLQDDNARLAKDLNKVIDELDKSERRRQSIENQNQELARRLDNLQNEYDTLKELAKSQRREAEGLLKKRHDQVSKLKKDIGSLKEKAADWHPETLNRIPSHNLSKIGTHIEEQVREATQSNSITHVEDLMSFETTPPKAKRRRSGSYGKRDSGPQDRRAGELEGELPSRSSTRIRQSDQEQTRPGDRDQKNLLDSKIPTMERSVEKLESIQQEGARKTVDSLGSGNMTSKNTALSEIINNARADNSPARNGKLPASQLSASFNERFSGLCLNSPGPAPPSSEPSFTYPPGRKMHDKRTTGSPRPSMFNIPSSPPKQTLPRPRSSGTDANRRHSGNALSSRLSSMNSRTRIVLPSDRAAAAKARLEKKSAEKKMAQELAGQKENISN